MNRIRRMELATRCLTLGGLLLSGCANLGQETSLGPSRPAAPPMMSGAERSGHPASTGYFARQPAPEDLPAPNLAAREKFERESAIERVAYRPEFDGDRPIMPASATQELTPVPGSQGGTFVEVTPPLTIGGSYGGQVIEGDAGYGGYGRERGHHAREVGRSIGRAGVAAGRVPVETGKAVANAGAASVHAAGAAAHATGAAVGATADVAVGTAKAAAHATGFAANVVTAPFRLTGKLIANHGEHERMEEADKAQMKEMGLVMPEKQRRQRRDMARNRDVFPRELRMASHPMYIVEPPDVLYVNAKTSNLEDPIEGERLVRQDGTISLGLYGQLHVAGLTLAEIEQKIRQTLFDQGINEPKVYVDVAAFNSKVYYVLGQVQQTGRLPVTGKETVLDALVLAGGPTNFAKLKDLHVARPNPGGGCDQVLWVDYRAITECGDTRTNYQLLPGDRVVLPSTRGFRTNIFFDNFLSPVERIGGVLSLYRIALGNNNNNN